MIAALTEKESRTIYCVRCFAILSTITAHLVHQMAVTSSVQRVNASVWTLFGQIGVVTFFVLSGFLYQRRDADGKRYWKKKAKRIILPWLVSSLLTYAFVVILEKKFSVNALLCWVIGSGSWYYYVTVYLFCLACFGYIYRKPVLLWFCVVISGVSLWLTSTGLFDLEGKIITNYLNVFNWVGFFALGVLARRYWKTIKNCTFSWVSIPLCLVLGIYLGKNGIYTYFHPVSALFEFSGCICLVWLCRYLAQMRWAEFLVFVGKDSYFIYLWHMQIVQKASNMMPKGLVLDVAHPFIGLFIMVVLLWLCRMIAKKVSVLGSAMSIIGISCDHSMNHNR